jgi:hypothetical protein
VGSFPTEEQAAQSIVASSNTSSQGFILRRDPTPDKSKYMGVALSGSTANPYRATMCSNNAVRHLGSFLTEEEAALAYLKEHLQEHFKKPPPPAASPDQLVDEAGLILRASFKPCNKSKFRGVNLSGAKWYACITENRKGKYLGQFDTELEAARCYLKAATESASD